MSKGMDKIGIPIFYVSSNFQSTVLYNNKCKLSNMFLICDYKGPLSIAKCWNLKQPLSQKQSFDMNSRLHSYLGAYKMWSKAQG